jgi:UDP-2,3-diacylglucosamine hydrolase
MISSINALPPGKKIFFASDFHLGVPNHSKSLIREKKIVRWLDSVKNEAHSIFIMGDIFDFWFEYKYTIPKGYIRLQGKLAEISDMGIPISFFTGNHDMWMFDYFTKELNIPVYRQPEILHIGKFKFLIGHGDGLGPGDTVYKLLKKVFANKFCQWLFSITPPIIGMGIATRWSKRSRLNNEKTEKYLGDKEWLYVYCKQIEQNRHHDFYIFGHRHLPLDLKVAENSRYINLGEWVNHFSYAEFDGKELSLKYFEKNQNNH